MGEAIEVDGDGSTPPGFIGYDSSSRAVLVDCMDAQVHAFALTDSVATSGVESVRFDHTPFGWYTYVDPAGVLRTEQRVGHPDSRIAWDMPDEATLARRKYALMMDRRPKSPETFHCVMCYSATAAGSTQSTVDIDPKTGIAKVGVDVDLVVGTRKSLPGLAPHDSDARVPQQTPGVWSVAPYAVPLPSDWAPFDASVGMCWECEHPSAAAALFRPLATPPVIYTVQSLYTSQEFYTGRHMVVALPVSVSDESGDEYEFRITVTEDDSTVEAALYDCGIASTDPRARCTSYYDGVVIPQVVQELSKQSLHGATRLTPTAKRPTAAPPVQPIHGMELSVHGQVGFVGATSIAGPPPLNMTVKATRFTKNALAIPTHGSGKWMVCALCTGAITVYSYALRLAPPVGTATAIPMGVFQHGPTHMGRFNACAFPVPHRYTAAEIDSKLLPIVEMVKPVQFSRVARMAISPTHEHELKSALPRYVYGDAKEENEAIAVDALLELSCAIGS
jgi:hypothetical protein